MRFPTLDEIIACNEALPSWYHNLVANPIASVDIGADSWPVKARVADPAERRKLLDRITQINPQIACVLERTRREIPVVVLDRIESSA